MPVVQIHLPPLHTDRVRSAWRRLAWLADELLDRVPCREDGSWRRGGDWGCRWQLARYWDPEDFRHGP